MNNLTVIEHNNQRVLTTEQLAGVYGTGAHNIRSNHSYHKDNFVEGKHYYILRGMELKQFRKQIKESDLLISKMASQLLLWTERGASRHCKILDTPKAWEQFDHIEETYFQVKSQQQQPQPQFMLPQNYVEALEALIVSVKENQVLLPKAQKYDEFLDADGLTTMTNVGKHFLGGISANKVAKFLQEKEVLYKNKVDDCYVPRQGYEKYFKRVPFYREDYDGNGITVWNLKFNNQGINLAVDLFKGNMALV